MVFDASLYINRSFRLTDEGGIPMKKSIILLVSFCLILCMILTSCAEIPTQDPTGAVTAPNQSTAQQAPTAENTSKSTNKTENVPDVPNDSSAEQAIIFLHTDEDVDLSGVKIDISKKINIVVSGGLTTYETEYIGSAYSDSDGKIICEIPSEPFIMQFDLSSLPSGMGLTKSIFSYNENTSIEDLTVELHKVVSAEAYFAGENLNFLFKNADSENVLVKYKVESCHAVNLGSPNATPAQLVLQYRGDIDCTLTFSGNVNVGGAWLPYSTDRAYSHLDYPDYVSLLLKNALIAEDEKTDMLEKFYETEYGKAYQSGGCFH